MGEVHAQPAGGQFALGGGRVTGQGPAPKKGPNRPAHPGGLGFDGKHGTGYGTPHGDASVKDVQRFLNHFGFADDEGNPLAVDGKYGPRATSAVKKLQLKMGLKPTGKIDDGFVAKLRESMPKPSDHQQDHGQPTHRPTKKATQKSAPKPASHAAAKPAAKSAQPSRPHKLYGPAHMGAPAARAAVTTSALNDLPDSAFAYIEPGGSKDTDGKTTPRSLRHFPIHDPAHVRNALARAPQSPFGDKAMPKIRVAAKKFNITINEDSGRSLAEHDTWEGPDMAAAVERRFTLVPVEMRSGDRGQSKIGGYAAVFNKFSRNLGGFVENVTPAFFNKSRGDGWPDVLCRHNHDDNMLMGTTAARTLHLSIDPYGLLYEVIPPRSRSDVVELVERGDIRKSSFAFRVGSGGDDWGLSEQGYPQRNLVSGALIDVATVNSPAYTDSTASLRSLAPDQAAEARRLGLGPDAAYASLAARMDADVEDVRSFADQDELRRFFIRTDGPLYEKPKPRLLGAAAAVALLARRQDPWE